MKKLSCIVLIICLLTGFCIILTGCDTSNVDYGIVLVKTHIASTVGAPNLDNLKAGYYIQIVACDENENWIYDDKGNLSIYWFYTTDDSEWFKVQDNLFWKKQ